MDNPMIELRGQRVPLTQASYMRGWFVYQGGDYFEFRVNGPDGWLLSQSAEWDIHDPSHVVGRGATPQAAAEDFARSIGRRTSTRPGAPATTQECNLVVASIGALASVLGVALRLGYHDGQAGHAARTGNAVAFALGLACWNGLQQLQLRQAYMTGRQHAVIGRRRGGTRPARPSGQRTRRIPTSPPHPGSRPA